MISRSQMKRQLYQMGGLSSLYNIGSEGQKPIYPRISDIESSLSNAEQRIGDPSFDSFGGTNDGGFGSPMGGVYSGSMGGELPNEQPGLSNPKLITNPNLQYLINPIRPGVDTSQLGSPRTGAADGGLMNRQLYANGTGIAELLKMNQGAAQDQLTEEQAFAMMPEGVKEAYNSMLQAGASPEEARRLISQQLAEMSIQQMEMQRESQDIPEYYDRRLQILEPEQMREEMQNPSMPIRPDMAGGGIMNLPMNEMMVPRGEYGLGSIVKSVTGAVKGAVGAVKDIVSSDIGKLALLAAGGYYLGGGFGPGGFSFGKLGTSIASPFKALGPKLLGTVEAGTGLYGGGLFSGAANALSGAGKLASLIPGKGTLLSLGAGFLGGAAGSMLTPEQIQTGMKRDPAAVRGYLAQYFKNANPEATESEAEQFALEQTREYAAQGGRIGLAMGTMPMGEPRQNPQGIMELDYRQEGGFVPVGIKEKADDVPAMLSKNEFVFTADAVRNAGDGDVEKGAQRLYNTMKTLENGGTV